MLDVTTSQQRKTEERDARDLRVVVVTPLGLGGRGGIDRLMDELRPYFAAGRQSGVSVEFWTSRGQRGHAYSAIYLINIARRLIVRKMRADIDLVHINLSQDGSSYRKLLIAGLCRALSIPYVLHLHGSRYRQFWNKASPLLDGALTRMFANAARVVVLGQVWRDFIAAKAPAAADRISIFPTATRDPGPIDARPPRTVKNILFAGRHGARKGVPELLDALSRLSTDQSWRATLTGDGPIDETRAEISRLGIAERVIVPGWISVEAFNTIIADTDIFVLPSHDENLPLSVVEAFARSIAVVATPVGALPDIVEDGVSGLVIQPGDAIGLKHAIERLLKDDDLRAELGRGGRRVFEAKLDLDGYANRLVALWRDIRDRRPARLPAGGARTK